MTYFSELLIHRQEITVEGIDEHVSDQLQTSHADLIAVIAEHACYAHQGAHTFLHGTQLFDLFQNDVKRGDDHVVWEPLSALRIKTLCK